MAKKDSVTYDIKEDGINEIIDEKGNMVMMLREVAWGGREHKLELRKWVIGVDTETPMKGAAFMTEQGPHNLVHTMTKLGYGDTTEILQNIKDRDNFEDSLVKVIGKKKVEESKEKVVITEEDYFDPKSLI